MSENRRTLHRRIGLIGAIVGIGACAAVAGMALPVPGIPPLFRPGASVEPTVTPVPATVARATSTPAPPTPGHPAAPATPTPEPPVPSHPVLAYFPLYVGTAWTYAYAEEAASRMEDGSPVTRQTGAITETVAAVNTDLSDEVYTARIVVAGRDVLGECIAEPAPGSDGEYWMVADASRLFIACSEDEANALAVGLVSGPDPEHGDADQQKLPEFVFPLETGNVWQAFPGPPVVEEEGPWYQWYVESQLGAPVPAGTLRDCFAILMLTGPDTMRRWVCPGIGIAAAEYYHHGTVNNYRAELVSYEIRAGE